MTPTTNDASVRAGGNPAPTVASSEVADLYVGDESKAVDHAAEVARARDLAKRISAGVRRHGPVSCRRGAVPVDSGRPDAALRVCAGSHGRQDPCHRGIGPDRLADDRRARLAAQYVDPDHGGDVVGDRVDF